MIIMCLDHTRDYFQNVAVVGDPMDLETTTPALFVTRYITNFCAPVFVFLSGTSIYLQSQRKSKNQLAKFLFTRGLWLVFLEMVLNTFLWNFDIFYDVLVFQVIWAIGASMIVMAGLIYLHRYILFGIGLLIVFGHNLLDNVSFAEGSLFEKIWYFIHQPGYFEYGTENKIVGVGYPMLAWLGIMIMGYVTGRLYVKNVLPDIRKKTLIFVGFGALLLFVILRTFNLYGDSYLFDEQDTFFRNVVSFIRVTKYPPSLQFALITVGIALVVLAFVEPVRNKFTNFFITFGRVPLFFYFLHILVIHISSMLLKPMIGESMYSTINNNENWVNGQRRFLGIESLWHVYLAWILIIAALYLPCLYYMKYKAKNRDKKWLSYL